MARLVELRGGRKARGTGPDNGHGLPGTGRGRHRHHPPFLEAAVDDRHLDVLDGHGRVGDPEHAGALAGRRTDAPGELREVVGLVQPVEGIAPMPAVHEVVPLGNQVVDRAAFVRLAERDAAVHAPRTLLRQARHVVVGIDFGEVQYARCRVPVRRGMALELLESGRLAHESLRRRRLSARRHLRQGEAPLLEYALVV